MSRHTGRALAGEAHLRQSIGDILTTPVGTRVMRRDYGSRLADLVDQPANPATRLRLFAATALALLRWEPRIRVTRVGLATGADGVAELTVTGIRLDAETPAPAAFTLRRSAGGFA